MYTVLKINPYKKTEKPQVKAQELFKNILFNMRKEWIIWKN